MENQDSLFQVRYQKLKEIQKRGINPYPAKNQRDFIIAEAKKKFKNFTAKNLSLVGRLTRIRLMGKACFANLKDESGDIQIYLKYDELGKEKFEFFKKFIDLGDFLEIKGTLFKTHTGEITVLVKNLKLLTKTLRPLPEKWHGLKDVELRHRKRYLDLLANPQTKERFILRSKIINSIREFLNKEGFLEVETPILQDLAGGALAKPFITHHNALDRDLYLRIAPELYLKKLIIGGFEKIYEIGKAFRNEGIDVTHNPEFTILELYYAYIDYQKLMEFTENLFSNLIKKIFKKNEFEYQGEIIKIKPPFKKITYSEAIKKFTGIDIYKNSKVESLSQEIKKLKIENWNIVGKSTWPKLVDELFKEKVRENLIQPTFVINHPLELSPLAKKRENYPYEVERFQLYIGGLEIVNAFSELNDPLDQKERFEQQAKFKKAGDEEAMENDLEFIESLEYGMPPTAGLGIGIDRLTMLLTNQSSIREVIFFPQLRKKDK